MPEFSYSGVGKDGKKTEGKLVASTEGDLRMVLRGMGVRPTRISKLGAMNRDLGSLLSGGAPTVSLEGLVTFTRQLNVLISSGIPLVQALDILGDQVGERGLKTIVMALKEKVSSGTFLWEALSAYPKVFPKLYVALVRAGESAGAMDSVLGRLTTYLEDADRLRKLLKSAMMYPIIVFTIAIGVIALMMIFVIPKFEELLKGSGQELPGPTQFVIDMSHYVVNNGIYLVAGIGTVGYLFMRYIKSDEGRAVIHRLFFRTPLFGTIMQKGGVARFTRTMQTLLASGVNLIDAIDICKQTIDNAVLEAAVGTIRAEIEAGQTLGGVIERIRVFPQMAVQMIAVGESTGNLDKMLGKVADFYEAEVEVLVNGLTKLIEPFILVFLGGVVGGLLIAMYLPIFKLAGGA